MAMSASRVSRRDLESEVYVRYRHRRDIQKLKITFAWFLATFRAVFRQANEPIPSGERFRVF